MLLLSPKALAGGTPRRRKISQTSSSGASVVDDSYVAPAVTFLNVKGYLLEIGDVKSVAVAGKGGRRDVFQATFGDLTAVIGMGVWSEASSKYGNMLRAAFDGTEDFAMVEIKNAEVVEITKSPQRLIRLQSVELLSRCWAAAAW